MRTNLKQPDYREGTWRKGEMIFAIIRAMAAVVFLAYFFYQSAWMSLPLSFIGVLYFRSWKQKKKDFCREELTLQFKECILAVAASLKAGYSVENAFMESRSDMELLYGKDSYIYRELELIRRGLVINITLEEQLFCLAERSGSEEINQFATVFSIAKRSGGNLEEVIQSSSELIGHRLDARQEMRIMLSGRQMEQNIMKGMPFAVLGYIGISYPGYFDMLYHNWQGAAIMTGCLVVYLVAYMLGEKILQTVAEEIA